MKELKSSRLILILFIFFSIVFIYNVSDASEYSEINNRWFYIKNAYTGAYLDVANGSSAPVTNVQQYEYNGSSAQAWFIQYMGNGEYMIGTHVGSQRESDGNLALYYCLDVDNGTNTNGTQIHIWNSSINGITQTYTFEKTNQATYIIRTKCSNYSKVVSLADNLCNNGINIHQWEYSNHSHDQWILEPIVNYSTMGVNYARANHHNRLDAYADVSNLGGDCTNFVSQCLLAGGWHQDDTWYMRRKNTNYHTINSVSQLDDSWSLADPSPWISAKEFKKKFISYEGSYYCKGQDILDNPNTIYNKSYYTGDVIQYADNILGFLGDAKHTMYIRGYTVGTSGDNTYNTFELTYHTTDTEKMDLLTIAKNNKSAYFIFYDFTLDK